MTTTVFNDVVVNVILLAMATGDVRQRFVGSQHQKYSYQDNESLQDDEKRHSTRSRYVPHLW